MGFPVPHGIASHGQIYPAHAADLRLDMVNSLEVMTSDTEVNIPWDTTTYDPNGMWNSSNQRITLTPGGDWLIIMQVECLPFLPAERTGRMFVRLGGGFSGTGIMSSCTGRASAGAVERPRACLATILPFRGTSGATFVIPRINISIANAQTTGRVMQGGKCFLEAIRLGNR